jgi:hypothetical protein
MFIFFLYKYHFNPVKELRNIRNLKSKSLYLRIIPRSTFNQPYEILFRTRNEVLKGVLLGNTYNRLPPEQLEVASDSEISFIETKYENFGLVRKLVAVVNEDISIEPGENHL